MGIISIYLLKGRRSGYLGSFFLLVGFFTISSLSNSSIGCLNLPLAESSSILLTLLIAYKCLPGLLDILTASLSSTNKLSKSV